MIEDNEHMEDLGFIWSIPTSDLLSMFRILYAQELTPEEMLDHLYLVSDRQYFITDDDGSRMQIPEEVHFKIRAAQEPDIFDVDGLDD